ncbi:hypothetical protein D0859_13566 [Hortaea werneckii]|uniref:Uncharacterized protein n=1 Tax=Hortaea werneckii TaxID=91943 RepID=A0A3M7IAF4_HORWE|nr:hypothetical protein D0859_13566 [Hortaea werneckii]
MALKSPLMPSPTNGLSSAFSPYSDSPNSPAPYQNNFQTASNRLSLLPLTQTEPKAQKLKKTRKKKAK